MLRQTKKKKISQPENIFLIVAVILGFAFAIFQPLFIEPDASYHFDSASYLSNTVVDRAKVGFPGEDYQSTPVAFTTVSAMEKEGTYFKNFFETKLPIISRNKVPDQRVKKMSWRNVIMHLIPALGVKLGHALYPSIGSMVITARLFNLIFFVLALYLIIKKLKVYQLVFTFISLTPTIIQLATSLSYDCYNYVACAWLIATMLNIAAEIKKGKIISFKQFFLRMVLPTLAVYASKANSLLLLILACGLLLYFIGKKLNFSLNRLQGISVIALLILAGGAYFFINFHGTGELKLILSKFFYTFLEPYYTVLTTEVIGGTNTVGLPAWFFVVQTVTLVLLLLSNIKEVVPRWFAWGAAAVSAINLFGVLLEYAVNKNFTEHVITGPQGRYFTVFILLLAPVFTLFAGKISVKSGKWLKRMVITVSILALVLNLGITSVKFYHLQLPADEYRSGIEHYIFK